MLKEIIPSYIEDIAKRLHDPNQYGAASVMIGAGFSKNAIALDDNSNAPNWEELAIEMYEALYKEPENENEKIYWNKIKIRKTSGKNVLKLAEEYKVIFGRNKLDKFIEDKIKDSNYIPGSIHKKLLELNWRDVFTTNYDTLLERSIATISKKKNYKIILNQVDLPGSTYPRIIKLHGSIPAIKPYIISEEDYRTYPTKYAPLVNTVQQSMLETQLCLLGFSGDDPNFLNWLGWLRDNMGVNCPSIYLCGLFNGMSMSEKSTLESQNIVVIDLTYFVSNDSLNPHIDGILGFFNAIESYSKKNKSILDSVSYLHKHDVKTLEQSYYIDMNEKLKQIKIEISRYPVLPFNESKHFLNNITSHFDTILEAEDSYFKYSLIGNIVNILRKLYLPLYDHKATKLINLLGFYSVDSYKSDDERISQWFDMKMYLAEMYRVDWNEEKYCDEIETIEYHIDLLNEQQKIEFYFEMCKYQIANFDYMLVEKYLEKISSEGSFINIIRKACLFSQLGEIDKASYLLKKCSAEIAQRRYSEDVLAGLIGYLNLCQLSIRANSRDVDFIDDDLMNNKYNVKKIFNDIRGSLVNNALLAIDKRTSEKPGFNMNSLTVTYGTAPKVVTDSINDSFRYILFQDYLCLPLNFTDHWETISIAAKNLSNTSKNPFWKWSLIVRTNDEKSIDSLLTRELIVGSGKECARKLFDEIYELQRLFKIDDNYKSIYKILSKKSIYDVLSRVGLVAESNKVNEFLNMFFKLICLNDRLIVNDLNKVMSKISSRIDCEILKLQFSNIMSSPKGGVPYPTYFYNVECQEKIDAESKAVDKIILELSSHDVEIRDSAITKIVILEKYSNIVENTEAIARNIWCQIDSHGFPKSNIFNLQTWENLPYPNEISFDELYSRYLLNPRFPKCVEGNTIHGFGNVDYKIHSYMYVIYSLSSFQNNEKLNISWNKKMIKGILSYFIDYIQNERKLLNMGFDLFGTIKEAFKRYVFICDIVAVVVTQSIISNIYDEEILLMVKQINQIFEDENIPNLSLLVANKLVNADINSVFSSIVAQVMSVSSDDIRQAFISLDILLVYSKYVGSILDFQKNFVELISSIKYMDISHSRKILIHLSQIIERELFMNDEFAELIASELTNCFNIFNRVVNGVNKEFLEASYNLSKLSKKYYVSLKNNDVTIPDGFLKLISIIKESNDCDIGRIWKNIEV
ncbi:MAG: hypothetical protein CVV02_05420 [Firmicutes bacterium HGW-Firmicutes-7]|nr:MAG: hypothetical protein CVV02_05420 [Firmicutes bacterium HGW-Firmicutes-7]